METQKYQTTLSTFMQSKKLKKKQREFKIKLSTIETTAISFS